MQGHDLKASFSSSGASSGVAAEPLLSTKLYPPRLHAGLAARRRIVDLIGVDDGHPVVLVQAPAGYGKSTAVAEWAASTGTPVAWMSLDEIDNDPLNFFELMIESLRLIDPQVGEIARSLLRSPGPLSELGVARSLAEELSKMNRRFALVLDDYHVIESPAIDTAVGELVRYLPPAMRMFLISRTTPSIPLSRLKVSHQLLSIGADDLRFLDVEAFNFISDISGLELTQREVATLNTRTEGWPAGLRLGCIVLKGQPPAIQRRRIAEFSGEIEAVSSYLWEEVLAQLPKTTVRVLLYSSILDRFTGGLLDEILETPIGAEQIALFDRSHLFLIPLDDRGEWYRLHHLFRDVLRDRLAEIASEEHVNRLHRRASLWFEARGMVDEAARHAVAGNDWPRAERLLEPVAVSLYRNDQIASLVARLRGLPEETLARTPMLAFCLAWALVRSGSVKEGAHALRVAEQAWMESSLEEGLGRVAMVRCMQALVTSEFHTVMNIAERADRLLPVEAQDERAAVLLFQAAALMFLGKQEAGERVLAQTKASQFGHSGWVRSIDHAITAWALFNGGKLAEANALLQPLITRENSPELMQVQHSSEIAGNIHVEWNLLDEAERLFQNGLQLSFDTGTILWRGRLHLGLAKVARARGDLERAFTETDKAIVCVERMNSPHETRNALAFQARLRLDVNQLSLVRQWSDRADIGLNLESGYERAYEVMTYIRLLLAEQRHVGLALGSVDRLLSHANEQGLVGDIIELQILRAVALKSMGEASASLGALEEALSLGRLFGYVRRFLDDAWLVTPLLHLASARGANRDFAKRLLTCIDGFPWQSAPNNAQMTEELSEREIDVLRLVAAGLTNRDIGDRLFITEKTVKKHISNILGKLQATNRTQAVDQARRLGLIPA